MNDTGDILRDIMADLPVLSYDKLIRMCTYWPFSKRSHGFRYIFKGLILSAFIVNKSAIHVQFTLPVTLEEPTMQPSASWTESTIHVPAGRKIINSNLVMKDLEIRIRDIFVH